MTRRTRKKMLQHPPSSTPAFILASYKVHRILDEIYAENKWRAARGEKGTDNTVGQKFYSLVIHGCLRITGSSLLCTGQTSPAKFVRERMHCDERRKDLIYRRGKFPSSGAFRIKRARFSCRSCLSLSPSSDILSNLSPSFCPYCLLLFPIFFSYSLFPSTCTNRPLFTGAMAERVLRLIRKTR